MKLIDTHVHLLDERLDNYRKEMSFPKDDLAGVIEAGTSKQDSILAVKLANKYKNIYAIVGVHPEYAADYSEETAQVFKELAKNSKVVGIGEIGLDYHYDISKKDIQKEVFVKQLVLAKELNLPVAIHTRDATMDTLAILKEHVGIKGVMHCFSGTWEVAQQVLDLGFFIAIGGVVTFKNAKKTVEVIKNIDLSKLLLETDCPYLTPEPHRGELNMPSYVKYVAEKIAEIRGKTTEEIADITFKNSVELFNLSDLSL